MKLKPSIDNLFDDLDIFENHIYDYYYQRLAYDILCYFTPCISKCMIKDFMQNHVKYDGNIITIYNALNDIMIKIELVDNNKAIIHEVYNTGLMMSLLDMLYKKYSILVSEVHYSKLDYYLPHYKYSPESYVIELIYANNNNNLIISDELCHNMPMIFSDVDVFVLKIHNCNFSSYESFKSMIKSIYNKSKMKYIKFDNNRNFINGVLITNEQYLAIFQN